MTAEPTSPAREPARRTRGRDDSSAAPVVRRAPFSDNPEVGPRGQRRQQRILDAALQVFGAEGYHRSSIDRIAQLGGCSRVAFYQYFESKQDVFRRLANQVARQLSASTESLDALTPDADGWQALRRWVARYAEIYARYQPVFNAYQTAVESAEVLATLAGRAGTQHVARIHSRVIGTTLPPRQLDPIIRLFLETMAHSLDVAGVLRFVAPDAYPTGRVDDVITDVLHRTLFGQRLDVNVHSPIGAVPPAIAFDTDAIQSVQSDHDPLASVAPGSRALLALLETGRDVFVARGYHNTRVDDLIAAAGVSRSAFYRCFRDKDHLARALTARAERSAGAALTDLSDVRAIDDQSSARALRRWLRRYNTVLVDEAAMLRVFVDGAVQDPALRAAGAPSLDWGRRWAARYLRPRGFGDVDTEAIVMVALLGVFGARRRPTAEVEAAAHIIERGLLGL